METDQINITKKGITLRESEYGNCVIETSMGIYEIGSDFERAFALFNALLLVKEETNAVIFTPITNIEKLQRIQKKAECKAVISVKYGESKL